MNDLEQIKQRVKIVDLCTKHGVRLIKRGKNYVACCPFHNEKTPSFTINDAENFYKCFGCQMGGDVIEFYKDFFKLNYAQAIKELKALAGIEGSHTERSRSVDAHPSSPLRMTPDINKIKECLSNDELYLFDERLGMAGGFEGSEDTSPDRQMVESQRLAIRAVQQLRLEHNKEIFFELYFYCLTHFASDIIFNTYLAEGRKLSGKIIEQKEIFYIGNYNQVSAHMKKKFKLEDLQRSGLYNEKGNLIFFNHRLIIPYHYKNEMVYLRGRCIEDPNGFSKYLGLKNDPLNLNTPKRFYNVDVIERLFPGEHLYITEGEFDAVMMEDLGFNAIGVPGVGNTPGSNWLKRLFPFKVILTVDQDEAGKKLTERLRSFFNDHHKTIFEKSLGAKDVTEMVKGVVS